MKITKMHGLGNDFIVIDGRELKAVDYPSLARKLCVRRLNIGADGLAVIENSNCADIRMRIFNADGSEAEMCGNASRCFAKYVYDRGILQGKDIAVETLAGVIRPELIIEDGIVREVCVDMGKPSFERASIPMLGEGDGLFETIKIDGKKVEISSVLMGVPHTIVLCEDVDTVDFDRLGPTIEKHPIFPRKTNVNFVSITDKKTIRVRTWERGAGPTLACGTGSCASVVVLFTKGLVNNKVTVLLAAGSLKIEYRPDGRVFMTGPAEYVFEGETL